MTSGKIWHVGCGRAAVLAAVCVFGLTAFGSGNSGGAFVFLRPETTSFWNTATNSSMSVPVDFPAGSQIATLAVEGLGYSREYQVTRAALVGGMYSFSVPRPVSPQTENVYTLTLAFDGVVACTAKLGVIAGREAGSAGSTRCLAPCGTKRWERVRSTAVLPVPYGVESLEIDGVTTPTGLGGAQG